MRQLLARAVHTQLHVLFNVTGSVFAALRIEAEQVFESRVALHKKLRWIFQYSLLLFVAEDDVEILVEKKQTAWKIVDHRFEEFDAILERPVHLQIVNLRHRLI